MSPQAPSTGVCSFPRLFGVAAGRTNLDVCSLLPLIRLETLIGSTERSSRVPQKLKRSYLLCREHFYLQFCFLFIYLAVLGLSYSTRDLHCGTWAPKLTGSVAVAHRLSCRVACGIFSDQGLNPCPLHWEVDS